MSYVLNILIILALIVGCLYAAIKLGIRYTAILVKNKLAPKPNPNDRNPYIIAHKAQLQEQ